MLPIVASVNTFNFQTPLVNTTTPGTNVARVPYDNVPPSDSSEQVDNNTKGVNTSATQPADETTTLSNDIASSGQENSAAVSAQTQSNISTSSATTSQSAFVAQLAAQDDSPQTQVILVQYEKILANGNVKYKPSNALKPEAEPSNVFGRLLQSEKQTTVAPSAPVATSEPITTNETTSVQATPVASSGTQQTAEEAQSVSIQTTQSTTASSKASTSGDNTTQTSTSTSTDTTTNSSAQSNSDENAAVISIPPSVINAYTSTASRIDSFAPSAALASIAAAASSASTSNPLIA